jgi:hypothetical protein
MLIGQGQYIPVTTQSFLRVLLFYSILTSEHSNRAVVFKSKNVKSARLNPCNLSILEAEAED